MTLLDVGMAWDQGTRMVRDLAQPDADKPYLRDPVSLAAYLDPSYKVRAHVEVIGRELAALERGEFSRLSVDMPPQCGKTITTVVWGAFWWLVKHPTAHVMVVCYGEALAVKRGRAVRKLVMEYGAQFGLFLDPSSHAAVDWSLTTGGTMSCFGIRSGITGNPADVCWIDDPHRSRKEADSATIRHDVHNAYSGDIQSRLAPDAPIVLVATRWHDDDLTGHVWANEGKQADGGPWRVIHMPALCTDPETDPLGRGAGDPLPHPKVDDGDVDRLRRHWEGKRRGSTVRDWASLYQGDPRPAEGALLTRDLLRERRCYQHGSPVGPCCIEVKMAAVAVDPSGGGRNTAGIVGGYLGTDDRLYLTHDRTDVLPSDQWAREASILAAEIDADRVCIERNFGGDLATLAVRTAWDALSREAKRDGHVWRRAAVGEKGEKRPGVEGRWLKVDGAIFNRLCPRIVEVSAKKGKLLRAEPIAQQFTEDRIRFARALPETEDEWATWQVGSSDSPGRIDASVYLAYELLPVPQSGETSAVSAGALASANLLPWGR